MHSPHVVARSCRVAADALTTVVRLGPVLAVVLSAACGEPLELGGPLEPPPTDDRPPFEGGGAPSDDSALAARLHYAPDRILVRFRSPARAERVHLAVGGRTLQRFSHLPGLEKVSLAEGATLGETLAAYQKDPDVLWAEPDYRLWMTDTVPNDPGFGSMWGLHNTDPFQGTVDVDINAPRAWDITTGASDAVIGVIDSGADLTHPDLADNLWVNPGEIPGNGQDDDNNGWIDDVHGISPVRGSQSGNPDEDQGKKTGHGTHVAGTIAATGNNGDDVTGVAWTARIVPCQVFLGEFGRASFVSDAVACFDYYRDLEARYGVRVVATNNSWTTRVSDALHDAVALHHDAGILTIAAAGNRKTDIDQLPHYPASLDLPNVITVGAIDRRGLLSDWGGFYGSNEGDHTVHLLAPGTDVLSLEPGDGTRSRSGTSMAAPHVTGVAALLYAQDPTRTMEEIHHLLISSGRPVAAATTKTVSGRMLRAADVDGFGALTCANQTVSRRVWPRGDVIRVVEPVDVVIRHLHITCDQPAAGPVAAQLKRVDGTVLANIGLTGGGVLTGTVPATALEYGEYRIEFPDGEQVPLSVGYNFRPPVAVSYQWVDINGASPVSLPNHLDGSYSVALPFPVHFAGSDRTSLWAGTNGIITFDDAFTGYINQPTSSAPLRSIMAFWDDIDIRWNGDLRYATVGTAPQRQFIVEWTGVPHYYNSAGRATFQVVFREGDPDVRINYQDVTFENATWDGGASATVGLRVSEDWYPQHSYNTNALSDGTSLLFELAPRWQNPDRPEDVTGDGYVTPLDALVVINKLNAGGAGPLPMPTPDNSPPFFYDVSGDDQLAPVDALVVINELNARAATNSLEMVDTYAPWQEAAAGVEYTGFNWDYALGYHFTPLVDGHVTHLGGSFNGTKMVRLFDKASGWLLAEAEVTSSDSFAYAGIDAVAVGAGTTLTVAVYMAGSGGSYRTSLPAAMPIDSGPVTIEGSTYAYTGSDPNARPTNTVTTVMYGQADVTFTPGPMLQATSD